MKRSKELNEVKFKNAGVQFHDKIHKIFDSQFVLFVFKNSRFE